MNDPQGRGKASNVVTFSKKRAVDAVGGRMYIHMIDEDGTPIETWSLYNPWIKSVNFGDLDYESDELVNVEVGIRYDWAELETKVAPDRDLKRAGGFSSTPITNRDGRAPGV